MSYVDVSKESNCRSSAWKKIKLNKETQKAECQEKEFHLFDL